jgi:hypothetical protein
MEMSGIELDAFIKSLEDTLFEAKAKYQRAYAEKTTRAVEARKKSREELISNPRYTPPVVEEVKEKKLKVARKSGKSNLADMLGSLGLDVNSLMKDVKTAQIKKEVVQLDKERDERKAEREKEESEKLAALPVAKDKVNCVFSPSGEHSIQENGVCKWCTEKVGDTIGSQIRHKDSITIYNETSCYI